MSKIGKALKQARMNLSAKKGFLFTLRHVEDATGISNPYMSRLESGRCTNPSAKTLLKLFKIYEQDRENILKAAGF